MLVYVGKRVNGEATHEFEVCFDASKYNAVSLGGQYFRPFLPVLRILCSKVLYPIGARGLGITYIGHIIDMAFVDGSGTAVVVQDAEMSTLRSISDGVESTSPPTLGTAQCFEITITSCSPHITLCLSKPPLPLPTRKPSLPATSSLQSLATTPKMLPAWSAWSGCKPNRMHLPTRCLRSESQRGESIVVMESADAEADARSLEVL